MKILANENIPGLAVFGLRQRGHDVLWIRETAPGISDSAVLLQATTEGRLLITFDKDFGELAFRRGFPAISGVVLFRPRKAPPTIFVDWIIRTLESRNDWDGHFAVIEVNHIRISRLPNFSVN
jgi:predicted nuclease of predicted toxin-antitoxin system